MIYVLKSEDYYRNFKQSIKSKYTLESYNEKLRAFMKYNGIPTTDFASLIEGKDIKEIELDIIRFIDSLKQRHYTLGSQKVYLNALIHFFSINDVILNRKKIAKFLSNDDTFEQEIVEETETKSDTDNNYSSSDESNAGAGDKPYTHQQIAKLLEFADLRTKVIILVMASAGLRLGALELLRIGDLISIPKHNLYQIRVYANSKKNRHYTFCTPECKIAVDNYLNYRKSCGENITPRSPLLRREFDRDDIFKSANDIKPLTRASIKKSLHEVLYASGLRSAVAIDTSVKLNNRRAVPMAHGFRKFFDTNCTHSGMNPIYIEWCLGHSLKGVKDSYFLPQPDSNGVYLEILEGREKSPGYIDAIDSLTINQENRLRRENQMLKVNKSEIEQLKEKAEAYESFMTTFNPRIEEFQREINSLRLHLNSETNKNNKKRRTNSKKQAENITIHHGP
jgi:integrase